MKIGHTLRGFELIEFTDRYGESCSLQQSSLAEFEPPGSSALWFGIDTVPGARMHLDLDLVKELLVHLESWVGTGSLAQCAEEPEKRP